MKRTQPPRTVDLSDVRGKRRSLGEALHAVHCREVVRYAARIPPKNELRWARW